MLTNSDVFVFFISSSPTQFGLSEAAFLVLLPGRPNALIHGETIAAISLALAKYLAFLYLHRNGHLLCLAVMRRDNATGMSICRAVAVLNQEVR
jgi:hypothetical protein